MNDSSKRIGPFLALIVALLPPTAFAQVHGGEGARPAPGSHPAAPAPRQAPVLRPDRGGFNFNHDIAPAPAHPTLPVRSQAAPFARGNRPGQTAYPPPVNDHRAPFTPNKIGGPHNGHFGGHPIRNPRFDGRQYGWNNGVAWRPASNYWGGGFWGPFALADLSAVVLFGSVLDAENNVYYPSYQVEPDTPGYDILNDYGLQQVECGPAGLVEIWGPDDSVVCADPNDQVAAGNYEVDPATFTLVPAT